MSNFLAKIDIRRGKVFLKVLHTILSFVFSKLCDAYRIILRTCRISCIRRWNTTGQQANKNPWIHDRFSVSHSTKIYYLLRNQIPTVPIFRSTFEGSTNFTCKRNSTDICLVYSLRNFSLVKYLSTFAFQIDQSVYVNETWPRHKTLTLTNTPPKQV